MQCAPELLASRLVEEMPSTYQVQRGIRRPQAADIDDPDESSLVDEDVPGN